MSVGRAMLRAIVGALFVGHGTQKLFGWFGGGEPDATARTMEKRDKIVIFLSTLLKHGAPPSTPG